MATAAVDALLADIQTSIRDLPEVDAAAKLRALASRVQLAVNKTDDLTQAVTQLEQAASAALDKDPWVVLHRTATELLAALNLRPST